MGKERERRKLIFADFDVPFSVADNGLREGFHPSYKYTLSPFLLKLAGCTGNDGNKNEGKQGGNISKGNGREKYGDDDDLNGNN